MKRAVQSLLVATIGLLAPGKRAGTARPDRHAAARQPAVEREEHRLRLRRRPVGRRPRRQEPAPAHHRHRPRIAPGLLARRPDDRLQRPVRRQHRRLHHPARRRHADAADLAPRPGHRSRLHPGRQGRPVLVDPARLQRTATSNSSRCRSTGGMPTQLPIPWGFEAALLAGRRVHRLHAGPRRHARSGSTIAAAPTPASGSTTSRRTRWSRSRSRRTAATTSTRTGSATRSTSAPTAPASTTCSPTTPASKEIKQVTKFTDFPVLDINTDGKKLIFEQAGYLHLLTPGESQPQRLKVGIADRRRRGPAAVREGVEVRPRRERLAERARAWRSSSAARS